MVVPSLAAIYELDSRFKWLTAFFRSYYCFFALYPRCDELDAGDDDLLPFRHMSNVLLYDTIISWCKIFGVNAEDCHWKKVVKNHDEFREFMFSRLALDQNGFAQYQASILQFRNKWVVHFDPNFGHDPVPTLDVAHGAALALHDYLRANPIEGVSYKGPEVITAFGASVAEKFINTLFRDVG